MESTEPDASVPMGLWEFTRHIRTITVMGTTIRLVVPTDPTERGASDHMGLRSSAGPISGNNSGAAASREPKLRKGNGGGRRADFGFDPCGGSPRTTIQQPLDIGAVFSFLPPGCDLLRKGGGDCSGERNHKRMLADRRYRYGDPKSPCGFLADMVFWVDRFPRPLERPGPAARSRPQASAAGSRRLGISVWIFDTDLISRARHAAKGRGCDESP
jgi:hypothetical protein